MGISLMLYVLKRKKTVQLCHKLGPQNGNLHLESSDLLFHRPILSQIRTPKWEPAFRASQLLFYRPNLSQRPQNENLHLKPPDCFFAVQTRHKVGPQSENLHSKPPNCFFTV